MSKALPHCKTFVELLRTRAVETPNDVAIRFLADGENESDVITYRQLDVKARAIADRLSAHSEPGDRVLLCYPPGIEFICGFLGSLYARMLAVPIYPPGNQRAMGRFKSVIQDCKSHVILCDSKGIKKLSAAPELIGQHWLDTEVLDRASCAFEPKSFPQPDEVAFLQYTSGSTGSPKGVMVTHGNIIENLVMLADVVRAHGQTGSVSWLPVYHDMGLIAGVLLPIFAGYPGVLMPPMAFIEKPLRWLTAVAKYKASFITAPNFAYDLILRKVKEEDAIGLDLSCLDVIANAAEPVRAETLYQFQDRFAKNRLTPNIMLPSYGLAEATLIVSGKHAKGTPPITIKVDREALDAGRVQKSEGNLPKIVVGCGEICVNQTVAIVDPQTKEECAPGVVGEIWVSGKNIAQGYWNRPRQTEEEFHAQLSGHPKKTFLRTGDLGFVEGNELFITGRLKDMMILFGRNFYPQDIEHSVEMSSSSLRPGSCVAFAMENTRGDELCIVAEISRSALKEDLSKVVEAIQKNVGLEHELSPAQIHFLKPGGLPKTTSGKLQRKLTSQLIAKNEIEVVYSWPAARPRPIVEEKTMSEKTQSSEPVETLVTYVLSEANRSGPLPEKVLLACMKLAPEVYLRLTQTAQPRPASTPLQATKEQLASAPTMTPAPPSPANGARDVEKIRGQLIEWLARAAETTVDKIDPSKPIAGYGLDSLMAYEMVSRIKENYDIAVPNSLLWDYPTLDAVADYLVKALRKKAVAV